METKVPEKLNNLSKVSQLPNSWAGIWYQDYLNGKNCHLSTIVIFPLAMHSSSVWKDRLYFSFLEYRMRCSLSALVDYRYGEVILPESNCLNYWNDGRKSKSLQGGTEGKLGVERVGEKIWQMCINHIWALKCHNHGLWLLYKRQPSVTSWWGKSSWCGGGRGAWQWCHLLVSIGG